MVEFFAWVGIALTTIAAIVFVLTMYWGLLSAAPWVVTKKSDRRRLAANLDLRDVNVFYDLGAGSAELLFELSAQYPRTRFVGVEIAVLPYLISLARKFFGGRRYQNVVLRYGNLFQTDLRDADVILFYMLPKAYGKLAGKLSSGIKDDCLIVTEVWPFGDLSEKKKVSANGTANWYFYEGRQFKN